MMTNGVEKIAKSINTLLYILVGYCFWIPIAYLIPKKKGLILCIGREEGKFLDNTKYFFIFAKQFAKDLFWISRYKEQKESLGSQWIYIRSIKAVWSMLRCEFVVIDNTDWIYKHRYHMLYRAKKMQLWHGIGCKSIELDYKKSWNQSTFFSDLKEIGVGRFPTYDWVLSTSSFFTHHIFGDAFHFKKIVEAGYPRNQFLENKEYTPLMDLGVDFDIKRRVIETKENGKQVILYTPTFRDTGLNILHSKHWNFDEFDLFLEKHSAILVIKSHPDPRFDNNFSSQYRNIYQYRSDGDIQPMFIYTDVLITDYSSIYFDYLLTHTPALFYCPDYNEYVASCRSLKSYFSEMSPQKKAYTQQELQEQLKVALNNSQSFDDDQNRVKSISFETDSKKATEDILKEMGL